MALAAGTYTVEWYRLNSRETVAADPVTVPSDGRARFSAPFEAGGPAVLYLKRASR